MKWLNFGKGSIWSSCLHVLCLLSTRCGTGTMEEKKKNHPAKWKWQEIRHQLCSEAWRATWHITQLSGLTTAQALAPSAPQLTQPPRKLVSRFSFFHRLNVKGKTLNSQWWTPLSPEWITQVINPTEWWDPASTPWQTQRPPNCYPHNTPNSLSRPSIWI